MTTQFRLVNGVSTPLTDAEIAERGAEEAAWAAGAAQREIEALEVKEALPRLMRDLAIAGLGADHPKRVKAEEIEARAVELGLREAP